MNDLGKVEELVRAQMERDGKLLDFGHLIRADDVHEAMKLEPNFKIHHCYEEQTIGCSDDYQGRLAAASLSNAPYLPDSNPWPLEEINVPASISIRPLAD